MAEQEQVPIIITDEASFRLWMATKIVSIQNQLTELKDILQKNDALQSTINDLAVRLNAASERMRAEQEANQFPRQKKET